MNALLTIKKLTISFNSTRVVNNLSCTLYRGETFALVGESGSGKSITALSVIGLLPTNATISAEILTLNTNNLLDCSEEEMCGLRGNNIGFIFQDPMSSLNPVMTIGHQIAESLAKHLQLSGKHAHQRVIELLRQVEMPDPEQRYKSYPHQLSGGQRQRVMIAIALAGEPELLIADEPTTALDVTIQAQILNLLKKIQRERGMTLWLISHDLALVATIADRIAVMQQGEIVETNSTEDFFAHATHPYTQQLLNALPTMDRLFAVPKAQRATVLEISHFCCEYPIKKGLLQRTVGVVRAVHEVSFSIQQGKTLALVGESGCGKTTLGKSLVNLIPHTAGKIIFEGQEINTANKNDIKKLRTALQLIFQDPFSAMNPRMLISDIIAEGLENANVALNERQQRIEQLLTLVDLPINAALRYPHEFSGGQRQRICIARALAVNPKLLICDEPTSALDVSVQAQIIALLKALQQDNGISYLFITHDLALVAEIADDVAVMYQGQIIEIGTMQDVLNHPQQDYTKKLLAASPTLKRH